MDIMNKEDQNSIIRLIKEQIEQRIRQKYNWKRKIAFSIMLLKKRLSRIFLLTNPCGKCFISKPNTGELGTDELGRDIALYLKKYASLLRKRRVKLHTLIVLGSRAKGRGKPESDVDIMIIASDLPGRSTPEFTNAVQKILNIRRNFLLTDAPLFIGVEPTACSREEFLQWLKEFKVVALDAIYYGKVIYDDGFWKMVLQYFRKIEKKYGLNKTKIKEMLSVL